MLLSPPFLILVNLAHSLYLAKHLPPLSHMAEAHDSSDRSRVQSYGLFPVRRPFCCGVQLRRRKTPVARLGGKKLRRAVVIWRMLVKKVKEVTKSLMKDMGEAGTSAEAFHQRLLMETCLAIPIMGVSLSNYPSVYGSHPPLSLYY